jgi:hypothetical protein
LTLSECLLFDRHCLKGFYRLTYFMVSTILPMRKLRLRKGHTASEELCSIPGLLAPEFALFTAGKVGLFPLDRSAWRDHRCVPGPNTSLSQVLGLKAKAPDFLADEVGLDWLQGRGGREGMNSKEWLESRNLYK